MGYGQNFFLAESRIQLQTFPRFLINHLLCLSFLPRYIKNLPAKQVCFRKAVLVAPGYSSAIGVTNMKAPSSIHCKANPAVLDFGSQFVTAMGLKGDEVSDAPGASGDVRDVRVTLIFRKDYLAHPRLKPNQKASRKIANEQEVQEAAERIPGAVVKVASFEFLSITEQLELIRQSDVLVGVHGAALSYIPMLRAGSQVVELMPPKYKSRVHFKYFATWAGLPYRQVPIAGGKPDHVVNVDIFLAAVQQAVQQFQGYLKSVQANERVDGHRLCVVVPFRDSTSKTSQGMGRTDNLNEFVSQEDNT